MKTVAKTIAVILALGAVGQAVLAYSERSERGGKELTPQQCDDLRVKLESYFASEEYNKFYSGIESNEDSKAKVDRLVNDLREIMVNKQGGEPGP